MRYKVEILKSGAIGIVSDLPGQMEITTAEGNDPIVETRLVDEGEFNELKDKHKDHFVSFDHGKKQFLFKKKKSDQKISD